MFLLNAFSINMLQDFPATVKVEEISKEYAQEQLLEVEVSNLIGHPDTDRVVRKELDIGLPEGKRETVKLFSGEWAVVAQYIGPRLEEGATQLPEDAKIKYFLVIVDL